MRKRRTKIMAIVLSAAMAFGAMPAYTASAAGENKVQAENGILAEFNFEDETNGFIGGGAKAVKNGSGLVISDGIVGNAVRITGSGSWMNVVTEANGSLLTGKDEVTISYYSKSEKDTGNWSVFAAPNTNKPVYLNEHYLGVMDQKGSVRVERYHNTGTRPPAVIQNTAQGVWKHVAVVVETGKTTLYINGKPQSESSSYQLSDMLGANSVLQLGKGNWDNGEYFNGYLDEFIVYDHALTQEEITGYIGETIFWEGVSLPDAPISESLTLPETNTSGDAITWSSSNTDILGNDGTLVNSPDVDTQVTMTANIGGKTKPFIVTVAGTATLLQEDFDALTIVNADDVRGNLSLVKKGKNGSDIEWTSGNPAVVTDSAGADSRYDGGIVKRPDAGSNPVPVILTATLTSGSKSKEKSFTVTVQPKQENLDTNYNAGYLWTNFGISGGYEKIFLGYSTDGLNWKKLNKDESGVAQPILENNAPGSDLGVRDPHLIRSPEGDKYWILGTDLHAEGGGAGGSGWNSHGASKNLLVWESTDLVNWSEPSLVFAGLETAGCVWAPEAYYDEASGDYMVYWSARDEKKHDTAEGDPLCVYLTRTRDFRTFSEPEVWLDESVISGKDVNIIDSSLLHDEENGKYYRFSTSDWNTVLDVSDSLSGPWSRIINRGEHEQHGFSGVEGFTAYQLPDGKWCAMGDNGGYKAFVTQDLAEANFTKVSTSFDETFRHGTVMRLSKAEEARVLKAYGDMSPLERPSSDENGMFYSQNFESGMGDALVSKGAVQLVNDNGGKALQLSGQNGAYAALPAGWMDGLDTATISFDIKTEKASGNFFTFAIGQDSNKYMYLRTREQEFYAGITKESYQNESGTRVNLKDSALNQWKNVTLVFDGNKMYTYVDGVQEALNEATTTKLTELGETAKILFGKSFYSGDSYFKGAYDNIKMYDRALSEKEIADANGVTLSALKGVSAEGMTVITEKTNSATSTITLYVSKNNSTVDLTKAALQFKLAEGAAITSGEKQSYDLTKDVTIETTMDGAKKTWTIQTVLCNNPVLPGQFADPDIDAFNGKYYLYPTTDGFSGWSGTKFHVFSSDDMVNWKDEGVILDLKANTDGEAGKNEQGVQIAPVPWSDGSAWAPTIEEKNGKYYFYFCGNDTASNSKAMGVAVADSPTGPFKVQSKPLVTKAMCSAAGVSMGQTIDPSIFTDDDGRSYMLFGNGNAAIVELNEDMVSIKEGTMKNISGATDIREAITVTKRNGVYHFTWSCDDTGSENYSVNYGTSDKLYGPIQYRSKVLSKVPGDDILGTGHHSILQVPGKDEYYIAYHRFVTPLGQFTSGFGFHRETCIDKVTFDETTGLMNKITPTLTGITEPVEMGPGTEKVTVTYQAGEHGTIQGQAVQTINSGGDTTPVTAVADSGYEFKQWSDGNTNATRNNTGVTESVTITAEFVKIEVPPVQKVTLTYKATTGGTIQGTTIQTVEKGKDAKTVKAVAKSGYRFTQWSDGVKSATRTDKNVQSSKTLTAKFEKIVVQVSKVKLDKTKLSLGVKETFQLKATVSPSNATVKTIKWKSSSSAVSVTSKGKVTAKKAGSAVITATANNGKKATCKITVKAAPKSITLNAKATSLKKGKSFQIKVKLPKNTYSNKITYTSSKKSVASVSTTGKVKALKKGKANITAKTFNGKKATLKVTVK